MMNDATVKNADDQLLNQIATADQETTVPTTVVIQQQDYFNEQQLNSETFTLTYQLSAPFLMIENSIDESVESVDQSSFG